MWLMIASSISSPPTRIDWETTMPPSEMTATSRCPADVHDHVPGGLGDGEVGTGIAAAIGSSIR